MLVFLDLQASVWLTVPTACQFVVNKDSEIHRRDAEAASFD